MITGTAAGYTFTKDGNSVAVSSVTGSGTNTLTFEMGSVILAGETVLISYASGSGNTKDAADNALASFSLRAVTNDLPSTDTYFTWAVKDSNMIIEDFDLVKLTGDSSNYSFARSEQTLSPGNYLYFTVPSTAQHKIIGLTKVLNPTNYPDFAYSVKCDPDNTIGVLEGGNSVAISGGQTYASGDKFRIFYNGSTIVYQKLINGTYTTFLTSPNAASGSYYVGVALHTLNSDYSHIYQPTPSPDTIVPALMVATVENTAPDEVVMTFNEALLTSSVPEAGAFAIAGKTVTAVEVVNTRITLTVDTAFAFGDEIEVAYTPGTTRIKDLAGNEAVAFTATVGNNVAVATSFLTFGYVHPYFTPENNGFRYNGLYQEYPHSPMVTTATPIFKAGTRFMLTNNNPTAAHDKIFGLTKVTEPSVWGDYHFVINIDMNDVATFTMDSGSTPYPTEPTDTYSVKIMPSGQVRYEISKDGGATWTTMHISNRTATGDYYGMLTTIKDGAAVKDMKISA